MAGYELTFKRPELELHPEYKRLLRWFKNHDFCIMDAEMLLDPTFNSAHQLEAFRCAIREVCNERDRNLIIDDKSTKLREIAPGVIVSDIIYQLAPKGHPGTVPEDWYKETQGAVSTKQPVDDKPKFII